LRYNLLFTLVFFVVSCKSQEVAVNKIALPDTSRVKIVFVGDVMGHMPVVNSAWVDSINRHDFNPIFEYVTPYISKADIAVANLEVPLAGKPYSGYPQFSSPDALGEVLKNSGFDVVIAANNHALDRGKQGLIRTLTILDSLNLKRTGVFKDTAERRKHYPLFIEINKIKVAILNYTYSTNGYKPQKPVIVNYLDTLVIKKDIQQCQKHKADIILVTVHWGTEYDRFSDKDQRKIADFIGKNGGHAIIGSHPHVIQPFSLIYPFPKDSSRFIPVLYSMGNFISNQRDPYRDGGIIYELQLEKIRNTTTITSAGFIPVWVYKSWYENKMMYKLIPPQKFEDAKNRFKMNKVDSAKCVDFYNQTREHLGNLPEIILNE
jgi:poly-gamma-glutamate synthesis protein (capsule biosynthesis protein)